MRASTRRAGASFLFCASLIFPGSVALADELLVMPYACTMVAGRPHLMPAPEHGHRIIGHREQRTLTACSPANPDMCRTYTVHRFNLDCEGARVPWISVAASAAEQSGQRAWIEDGRLRVRMPRSWSFEPGDPCARGPSFDDRFGSGRMRRYCADRMAMAPPPIVDMPFGFAPMFHINGIFVRAAGPDTGPPPPLPPIVAGVPPSLPPGATRPEAHFPTARNEPPAETVSRPSPPPERAPKDSPAHSAPPPKVASQARPQAAQPAPTAAASKPQPPAAPASSPPTPPGTPVAPTILNRPEARTTEVAEQRQPTTSVPKNGTAAREPQGNTSIPASSTNAAPQHHTTDAASKDDAMTVSLLSVASRPIVGIVGFFGLALALVGVFALARRREVVTSSGPRDIASVSLEGKPRRGQPGVKPPSPATPANAVPHQQAPGQPSPAWVEKLAQVASEPAAQGGASVRAKR